MFAFRHGAAVVLFACLLVCLFVCLFACLLVCLFACLFVCVFVCLFVLCSYFGSSCVFLLLLLLFLLLTPGRWPLKVPRSTCFLPIDLRSCLKKWLKRATWHRMGDCMTDVFGRLHAGSFEGSVDVFFKSYFWNVTKQTGTHVDVF